MDSAVFTVSSIGVLLPSFSLSTVYVNEHDCNTNNILCDIDIASVVGDASRKDESSKKRVSWKNSSEAKEKSRLLEGIKGNLRLANATFIEELKHFDTTKEKPVKMMRDLFTALTTGETLEVKKLAKLVNPKFIQNLEKYLKSVEDFAGTIVRILKVNEGSLEPGEEVFVSTISEYMRQYGEQLKTHIDELTKENYMLSGQLKIDTLSSMVKCFKLSQKLDDWINMVHDKMDILVYGKEQQNTQEVGTYDGLRLRCLQELQSIIDSQYRDHVLEINNLCSSPNFMQGKKAKRHFKQWLKSYDRQLSALIERENISRKILSVIKYMQEVRMDPQRKQGFINFVHQKWIDASESICKKAVLDLVIFKKDIMDYMFSVTRAGRTTNIMKPPLGASPAGKLKIANCDAAVPNLNDVDLTITKNDVPFIMRIIKVFVPSAAPPSSIPATMLV